MECARESLKVEARIYPPEIGRHLSVSTCLPRGVGMTIACISSYIVEALENVFIYNQTSALHLIIKMKHQMCYESHHALVLAAEISCQ